MSSTSDRPRVVLATVDQVLPRLGLAYVTDTDACSWGITRSTAGDGLDRLDVGAHVKLTIEDHDGFAVASAWSTLD
ncbi:hypothetical protein [Ideonella sp. A 288]|uniref:hypothetical protein n=1 Tax=Ideonella sp. A 288 TaxID=1962181 RepID=UPI000B4AF25E|nr:hypothetical protein [Ideonella sp. A 288]